jgi:broad specificity phosphatase PhoE
MNEAPGRLGERLRQLEAWAADERAWAARKHRPGQGRNVPSGETYIEHLGRVLEWLLQRLERSRTQEATSG